MKSFAQELTAIKGATKYLTEVTMKHFWEMLTSFFKKNLKVIKSKGESLFKKKLEEAANSDELTDEQKQSLERNKGKLIDSYDKVSFPAKKLMDDLPEKLGTKFAFFVIGLIEYAEKVVKFIKTTYRDFKDANLQIVSLVLFLKYSGLSQALGDIEEQSMDDLDINSSELIAVAPTTKNKKTVLKPGESANIKTGKKVPNPSKEAQPLPPGMSREDFEDRTPGSKTRKESLEKVLKPIIELMLKEQYNY